MKNKLIYKQILIEEMIGKTVESVVHEFDEIKRKEEEELRLFNELREKYENK